MFGRRSFGPVVAAITLLSWGGLLSGETAVTTAVAVTANPPSTIFGRSVTLTATVSSVQATGKVTFYDGANVLGTAVVSNGQALLNTSGIGYGQRQITAKYLGDSTYSPSPVSPPLTETITTNPGGAFVSNPVNPPFQGFVLQSIAAGDLNHDGFPDVVGTNGNGNTVGPNTVNVFLNKGDGTLAAGVPYLSGIIAYKIAIADVDLDGNPDLVVTAPNGIFVLKGKGDGTFPSDSVVLATNGSYDAGLPYDLTVLRVADVDLDGIPDIIVAHGSPTAVAVFLGNGDGSFQAPITTSTASTINDFVVADFNGDGLPDLAVGSASSLTVLDGAGDGTFSAPVLLASGSAASLTAADLNHDGIQDIAFSSSGNIYVLLGTAGGGFQQPTSYPAQAIITNTLAVTDVDGDGNADLVSGAGILFGSGDGTFGGPVAFSVDGIYGVSAVVADFNSDGIADLAFIDSCCAPGGPVSLDYGRLAPRLSLSASPNPVMAGRVLTLTVESNYADAAGTVTFSDQYAGGSVGTSALLNGSASIQIQPQRGSHIYAASSSGDSKYAATSAAPVAVLAEQPGTTLTLSASPNPATLGQQVTLTATLGTNIGNAEIAFYDGTTVLNSQTLYSTQATYTTILAAGTHQLRAVVPEYQGLLPSSASFTETVLVVPGGQLTPGPSYLTGSPNPVGIATADFNHDGFLDVAVADSSGHRVSVFPGTGSGIFGDPEQTQLNFAPGGIAPIQADIYGQTDLVVTDAADNAVQVLYYYQYVTFLGTRSFEVSTQPVAIATADFNNDGNADIVTANAGSGNVSVLLTAGNPVTWNPALNLPAGTYPDAVATGDFNGDGNFDFAVANRDSNNVMVFLGNGDGTFRPPVTLAAGSQPTALLAVDFNGDGRTDLAVCGATQISVFLGSADGSFSSSAQYSATGVAAIAAGDFTGDGILDMAAASSTGVLVYTGKGDGTFSGPANYTQYAGASAIAAGNFSPDGRVEIVVALPGKNAIGFLFNDAPYTAL